jgi:hypothetical protein
MICPEEFFDCSALHTIDNNLPRFCCRNKTRCIWTAANTTVVCCPYDNESNCNRIQPITCNIAALDSELNPDAASKTLALDVALPKCRSGRCCPHGYHCKYDYCEALADQNVPPDDGTQADVSGDDEHTVAATNSPTMTRFSSLLAILLCIRFAYLSKFYHEPLRLHDDRSFINNNACSNSN